MVILKVFFVCKSNTMGQWLVVFSGGLVPSKGVLLHQFEI